MNTFSVSKNWLLWDWFAHVYRQPNKYEYFPVVAMSEHSIYIVQRFICSSIQAIARVSDSSVSHLVLSVTPCGFDRLAQSQPRLNDSPVLSVPNQTAGNNKQQQLKITIRLHDDDFSHSETHSHQVQSGFSLWLSSQVKHLAVLSQMPLT